MNEQYEQSQFYNNVKFKKYICHIFCLLIDKTFVNYKYIRKINNKFKPPSVTLFNWGK